MDVPTAIETRIEVREYTDQPVDVATKEAILEAGRLASSGRNLEHWRFILIDAADRLARLGELSPTGSWVAGANFAIAVCTDPSYSFHEIDAGRAVTYMQLRAWADGVGSCLYTVDQPQVDRFLGIPDTYELTAVLGFGHPPFDIFELRGQKDRESLGEIAFAEEFGTPVEL